MKWNSEIISFVDQWDSGEITAKQYWGAVTGVLLNRDPNQYVIGPIAIGSCEVTND